MSVADRLIDIIAPHRCLGCLKEGRSLCDECAYLVEQTPPRCYRCKKFDESYRTCKSCRSSTSITRLYTYGEYSDVLKALIRDLKYKRNISIVKVLIDLVRLPDDFMANNPTIVPLPTTPSRIRQRGYDQSVLLAKRLATTLGLPFLEILYRKGNKHQVGSSASERRYQVKGSFSIYSHKILPKSVIIVDDVLTTGSSIEEVARVLKNNGVKNIGAVVIAQAI